MLCQARLCYAILCYPILCYTMLYYNILYYTIPYYTILYCTILLYARARTVRARSRPLAVVVYRPFSVSRAALPRILYIMQRGVQWKQGVVNYMMLYTILLYNTTPIHCTPLCCVSKYCEERDAGLRKHARIGRRQTSPVCCDARSLFSAERCALLVGSCTGVL